MGVWKRRVTGESLKHSFVRLEFLGEGGAGWSTNARARNSERHVAVIFMNSSICVLSCLRERTCKANIQAPACAAGVFDHRRTTFTDCV